MKKALYLFVLAATAAVFTSCKKDEHLEKYESMMGVYTSTDVVVLYEDSTFLIRGDKLTIGPETIGLSMQDGSEATCDFRTYESDSHLYDFKIEYSGTTLFYLVGGQLVEAPQPDYSDFNAGRQFYLKQVDESMVQLVVEHDNAMADYYTFTK